MATTYLSRTSGTSTNVDKCTFSAWIKRGNLTASGHILMGQYTDVNNRGKITFTDDYLTYFQKTGGSTTANVVTTRKFRDTSGWYNVVIAFDSTQGTEADRIKFYVNGVQETAFSSTDYSQNENVRINESSVPIVIGQDGNSGFYFDGSMSYVAFVDGTAELPGIFGETDSTTGEWKIKTTITPSVAWGNNGFLILKNGNSLTDESTNSNNFTLGGGTLTKTEDNPSNVFATLNPLVNPAGDTTSLSNGNNTYTNQNYNYNTRSTLGMTSGKFYWEQKVNNATSVKVGLCTSQYDPSLDTDNAGAYYGGVGGGGVYVLMQNSTTNWQRTNNNTSKNIDTYTNAIASTSSSILMGAVDVDAGKLWVGVDGVWMYSGNPATGANAQITFTNSSPDELQIMASHGDNSTPRSTQWNFGNGYFGTTAVSSAGTNASGIGIFEYDVPTGYTALSTKGLNL